MTVTLTVSLCALPTEENVTFAQRSGDFRTSTLVKVHFSKVTKHNN